VSAPHDSTSDDPQRLIAQLRRELAETQRRLGEALAEIRDAQDQQTATAEVLQVINSSPGDLAPVFDAMLGKALRLCDASFGLLGVRHGEELRRMAARNLPPAFSEYLDRQPLDLGSRTFAGQVFREAKVIHLPDILEGDPRHNRRDSGTHVRRARRPYPAT